MWGKHSQLTANQKRARNLVNVLIGIALSEIFIHLPITSQIPFFRHQNINPRFKLTGPFPRLLSMAGPSQTPKRTFGQVFEVPTSYLGCSVTTSNLRPIRSDWLYAPIYAKGPYHGYIVEAEIPEGLNTNEIIIAGKKVALYPKANYFNGSLDFYLPSASRLNEDAKTLRYQSTLKVGRGEVVIAAIETARGRNYAAVKTP